MLLPTIIQLIKYSFCHSMDETMCYVGANFLSIHSFLANGAGLLIHAH